MARSTTSTQWQHTGPIALWWQRHPLLQLLCIVGAFGLGVAGLGGLCAMVYFDQMAAKYDLRQVGRMPQESTVYDARGEVLGYLHGDGRIVVPLDAISEQFVEALIAREDARFLTHGGVDYFGVIRAALRNTRDGEIVQGASTLTMQLARNSFDMHERSLRRKMVEIALARRIESTFSKDEILYLYVNRIFFGSGLNGIEQAARGYFGKPAAALDLGEAAMIAGIIRAPNRFSPFRHYEAALAERDDTLARMVDEAFITEVEAEAARRLRPQVLPQSEALIAADGRKGRLKETTYLIDAVRQLVPDLITGEDLSDGGLEIHTTIDAELQRAAEGAVDYHLSELEANPGYSHSTMRGFDARHELDPALAPDYLQAALSLIENRTGAIRAEVGGRSFQHSEFNRATQSRRQLGSVFKPLVYAVAFETGTFPGTWISDDPIQRNEIRWHSGNWSPSNSDGQFFGRREAQFGLIRSRNTMAVRMGERAGIDGVLAMTEQAGLGRLARKDVSPQIYIGNLGASLQALTSAYSAFPSEGMRAEPFFIDRITNRAGDALFTHQPVGYRVISPAAAWLTASIMEQALEPGGTGASVRERGFEAPAGGKTGTTKDYRDAWFAGFTSELTCGVWVGLDQPETIIDQGYGGRIALPIWTDLMLAAESLGYPDEPLPISEAVMEVELCRLSGKLIGPHCRAENCAYHEPVPHSLIPRAECTAHDAASLTTRGEPVDEEVERGVFDKIGRALGFGE